MLWLGHNIRREGRFNGENECCNNIACYSEFHPLLNRFNCYIKAYITGSLAQNIQPNPFYHLNPSRTLNQEDGTTLGKDC